MYATDIHTGPSTDRTSVDIGEGASLESVDKFLLPG